MHQGSPTPPLTLRRLTAADAADFRALRLEGLRSQPEAFGASWDEEASRPLPWFAERLERNVVIGGWRDGLMLLGTAGLHVPDAVKTRHKGVLWGMFVRPEARGTGLAAALVACLLEQAATIVEAVQLSVAATNTAAVRLYARAGFREYGVERRALKIGDRYCDGLLMERELAEPG